MNFPLCLLYIFEHLYTLPLFVRHKDSLQRVADFLYSYTKYAYDWYKVLGNNDIDPAPLLESINIAYELYSLADSDENRQQNCEYIIAQLQEMA